MQEQAHADCALVSNTPPKKNPHIHPHTPTHNQARTSTPTHTHTHPHTPTHTHPHTHRNTHSSPSPLAKSRTHRRHEADDPLTEEPGINVVGSLPTVALLNHNGHHGGLLCCRAAVQQLLPWPQCPRASTIGSTNSTSSNSCTPQHARNSPHSHHPHQFCHQVLCVGF